MKHPRTQRIQRGVDAGLKRWPNAVVVTSTETPGISTDPADVVRRMPRRKISYSIFGTGVALPRARRVVFRPGIILPIVRLFTWIWGVIKFFSGNNYDIVFRRDTIQRRAVRLRRIFEDTGASFAKLGQQLSLRADVLPYAYCAELVKMLDHAPPFPTDQAIAIIERSLGRPLCDVFDVFDPDPIGSASLACVYQAKLRTGERVAVKVRRPGIGRLIAADLRALDWLLGAAEALTFIQPGLTRRFREDLKTILFNELNFRAEARYTELFRLRAAKHGNDVTAPRVYFQYCTEEVLVSELVSGVWMWELMAAVDSNDQQFLTKLREQEIEPKSLARKLIHVMHREVLEELFFHADPHPANLVVMPNNKICFIDFGAVGRFSTATRKAWREMQHHMMTGDVSRMVNCAINLVGPLPPIDVQRVGKAMEQVYADWLYAIKSRDAEWWEKSTAQAWLRFIEIAQQYAIPVSLETIQFFRATLLYDSIITRLNNNIDFSKEFLIYAEQAGKEARKRVQKRLKERLTGPTDLDYLRLEQMGDMATQFLFRIQRTVEDPVIHFRNIVGKISYAVSLLLRLGYIVAAALAIGLLVNSISRTWFGHEIDWSSMLEAVTSFGWIQVSLIVLGLVIIRRIVIRLNMPDSRLDPQ
jgi:ubiquinone biosynthesis protein